MSVILSSQQAKEEVGDCSAITTHEGLACDDILRLLNVYESNSISTSNFTLTDSTGCIAFVVEISQFKSNAPDLTLYAGAGPHGEDTPALGVANFVKLSSQAKLGLGDPRDPNQVVWEDLSKERINYSIYRWEMTLPIYDNNIEHDAQNNYDSSSNNNNNNNCQRHAFLWKRTHTVGTEQLEPFKLSSQCFKLVNEQCGEVLAAFVHPEWKSLSKTGQLEIYKSYGRDFDLMVILSGLAVFEKSRRRERRDPALFVLEAGKRIIGSVTSRQGK